MFGCFRRGDANDPDTYVAAIAAILAEYDPEVIRKVTDPRYGLPRRVAYMPNAKEVADACEAEQASADRIAKYRELGPSVPRLPRPRADIANLFVPANVDGYAAMVERTQAEPGAWRADSEGREGIWVPADWWEEHRGRRPKTWRRPAMPVPTAEAAE